MFGLEGQEKKKKKADDFVFELEKELKDPKKYQEINEKVERRIQNIKEHLRSGDDKQEFDRWNLLLLGYQAILKVMTRFKSKTK